MIRLLFSISLFLSASLSFVIQPIVAKLLLPVYGGTPAVWTVCMLFFQSLLLVAYGYAWFLSRFAGVSRFALAGHAFAIPNLRYFFTHPWTWRGLYVVLILLSLIDFPLSFTPIPTTGSPDLSILGYLIRHLSLPLIVLGVSAPLLQFAYSQTEAKRAKDPYFLYVASNIGSMLALLAYPWLIERYLGLKLQFYYWNVGFILYLITLFVVLTLSKYVRSPEPSEERRRAGKEIETHKLSWALVWRWVSYSFIPCSLMLAVSFYISTDIAATPLFWVIPLALYLLSFIITFAQKPIISHEWVVRHILFFIVFPMLGFIVGANLLPAWQLILFHLASFFMIALLCHGKLIEIRPSANQLTSFYFFLALGGFLAGIFNGVLAPRLFDGAYEYPIIFSLAMLSISLPKSTGGAYTSIFLVILLVINYFLPNHLWMKANHVLEILALSLILIWPKTKVNLFVGMTILFIYLFSPWFKQTEILTQQRNFYGVKQVLSVPGAHALVSQSTLHGFQFIHQPLQNNAAMAYYGSVLPVVERLQKVHSSVNAIIMGLGTGMLACQFRHRDRIKLIDIDKQVIDIATNTNYFTYLQDCPPLMSLVEGDGRKILETSQDANADLLVMDAFSSDAIPTHLLTIEAFKVYQQKISEQGIILANISNRHLHLLPLITAAGRELQLMVLHKQQRENYHEGRLAAEWVLLTANQQLAVELMRDEGWRFVTEEGGRLWTDDYSNIVPLVNWR